MHAHPVAVLLDYNSQHDLFGSLRYEVFVEQLGWVKGKASNRTELDEFDPTAHHLGVFIDGELVAYVRVVVADQPNGLLLQCQEFSGLSPPAVPAVATIAEVSRLSLSRTIQGSKLGFMALRALFVGVYQFCMQHGITELYAIGDDVNQQGYNHVNFLTKHLGFEVVGTACELAPGVDTKLLRLNVADALKLPNVQRLLGITNSK